MDEAKKIEFVTSGIEQIDGLLEKNDALSMRLAIQYYDMIAPLLDSAQIDDALKTKLDLIKNRLVDISLRKVGELLAAGKESNNLDIFEAISWHQVAANLVVSNGLPPEWHKRVSETEPLLVERMMEMAERCLDKGGEGNIDTARWLVRQANLANIPGFGEKVEKLKKRL